MKYHALLHKIFNRAVIDRAIGSNPASHTALPKVVTKPKQIITAAQFEQILHQLPARYQMMVLLAIEAGLRWGELIALRPCDIDMTTHVALVHRTIVEVTKKHSPTGQRIYLKNHPKNDEQRSVQIDEGTCQQLQNHIRDNQTHDDGLLFTSSAGTALSRNNFRTRFCAGPKACSVGTATGFWAGGSRTRAGSARVATGRCLRRPARSSTRPARR